MLRKTFGQLLPGHADPKYGPCNEANNHSHQKLSLLVPRILGCAGEVEQPLKPLVVPPIFAGGILWGRVGYEGHDIFLLAHRENGSSPQLK